MVFIRKINQNYRGGAIAAAIGGVTVSQVFTGVMVGFVITLIAGAVVLALLLSGVIDTGGELCISCPGKFPNKPW